MRGHNKERCKLSRWQSTDVRPSNQEFQCDIGRMPSCAALNRTLPRGVVLELPML